MQLGRQRPSRGAGRRARSAGGPVSDPTLPCAGAFPTGAVRLSELRSAAQPPRPGKAAAALRDDIITQRDDAGPDGEREPGEPEAAGPEGAPRRRKPARPPEAAARPEPEEKFRARRQRDFDVSEQNASSDEEGPRRERSRAAEEPWTQNQQKLLELALQQYPKGSSDRWDRIAKCVPSKSKVGEAGGGGGPSRPVGPRRGHSLRLRPPARSAPLPPGRWARPIGRMNEAGSPRRGIRQPR